MPSHRRRSYSRDRSVSPSRDRSRSPERRAALPEGVSEISESDYFLKSEEFRVWLKDEKGKERQFELVGTYEVDVLKGKVSDASPIGKALEGKHAGDSVELQGARGSVTKFTVVSVEY